MKPTAIIKITETDVLAYLLDAITLADVRTQSAIDTMFVAIIDGKQANLSKMLLETPVSAAVTWDDFDDPTILSQALLEQYRYTCPPCPFVGSTNDDGEFILTPFNLKPTYIAPIYVNAVYNDWVKLEYGAIELPYSRNSFVMRSRLTDVIAHFHNTQELNPGNMIAFVNGVTTMPYWDEEAKDLYFRRSSQYLRHGDFEKEVVLADMSPLGDMETLAMHDCTYESNYGHMTLTVPDTVDLSGKSIIPVIHGRVIDTKYVRITGKQTIIIDKNLPVVDIDMRNTLLSEEFIFGTRQCVSSAPDKLYADDMMDPECYHSFFMIFESPDIEVRRFKICEEDFSDHGFVRTTDDKWLLSMTGTLDVVDYLRSVTDTRTLTVTTPSTPLHRVNRAKDDQPFIGAEKCTDKGTFITTIQKTPLSALYIYKREERP